LCIERSTKPSFMKVYRNLNDRVLAEIVSPATKDLAAETGTPALPRLLVGAKSIPFLLYGVILLLIGFSMYILGVLVGLPRLVFRLPELLPLNHWLMWYGGIPTLAGVLLSAFDILFLLPFKRAPRRAEPRPLCTRGVTVALTAYNDEDSIGAAVRDFCSHPSVEKVITVSNNSKDATMARALEAGACVVNEEKPGYGRCVYRCFQEALAQSDSEVIVLCEGDMTFRAHDLDKILAYLPHADVVNGTRIVEQLRQYRTQLSTFMYYGNFFVGKLLEAKHLGKGTFTDVGTTYKALRRDALERLLPHLHPEVNLEFNAHFLDTALKAGESIVECPITFHPRVGKSKGGNVNNLRALKVGLSMITGLIFGWRWV
jgi:hypothetical protein